MTEFEIRPIQSTDEAAVSALLEKLWGGRIIVSRGKELDAATLPGFIAMEGTEIVGLVTLHIHEHACEIVSLDALRKGQGIGTALVKAATQWARANRCTRVWLITTNDNVGALTFYHKIGFRLVAVHLDAIETARKLKPQIPLVAQNGIPIRDEIEFALDLLQ